MNEGGCSSLSNSVANLVLEIMNLRIPLLDLSLGTIDVKLFPCLINHSSTKECGGVEV